MRKIPTILILLFVAIQLYGCINMDLHRENPNIKKYFFCVERDESTGQPKGSITILMKSFDVSNVYKGRSFVYKDKKGKFIKDFYNQFVCDPSTLITEQATNWFAQASFVSLVEAKKRTIRPDFEIQGTITELYADLADKQMPIVHVSIDFKILNMKEYPVSLFYQNVYSVERPAESLTAQEFINSWNDALKEVFTRFEADFKDVYYNK